MCTAHEAQVLFAQLTHNAKFIEYIGRSICLWAYDAFEQCSGMLVQHSKYGRSVCYVCIDSTICIERRVYYAVRWDQRTHRIMSAERAE